MKSGAFFSCGKVMLTGEYAVLRGAAALSLPTTLGQTLEVTPHDHPEVVVRSLTVHGDTWLQARYSLRGELLEGPPTALRLQALFQQALNLANLPQLPAAQLTFQLQFEQHWGLGSSATLVHLIAQWLGVDAMALFKRSEKGSGYDLATAVEGRPILYRTTTKDPQWHSVSIHWPFLDALWLVPTGGKQRSDLEVDRFMELQPPRAEVLERISAIGADMIAAQDLGQFKQLMHEHEQLTAGMIGIPPLQDRFPDPDLGMKSLGAWGGDLLLAAGAEADVRRWAHQCGFEPPQPFASLTVRH